ncbi:MAG: hypothetical protein P4L26_10105 [Terracidiphilus sp.]|nr:hypothetical protein [Terracidiphilus sp.]
MKIEEMAVDAADGPDQKLWYRVGSIAAIVLGIGYIVIFPLYARVGAPPSGGEAWFIYLPGKTNLWWAILGISVFTDFLYVPLALALYLALKMVNKNLMLVATAFIGLFVVLDLAITWSHYASILMLYSKYSMATSEVQRAGYLAAANYGSAVLTSPLEVVYAIVTLSFGILVSGVVMLRGVFDKITAYLALATGVSGIASLTGFTVAIIGNALFATVWLFFVGYRLYRLAKG